MKKTWLIFCLFSLTLLTACGMNKEESYPIQPFTFTDQNHQPFGSDQLKGKVWLANFIFTSCETVCPPMTASMAELRAELKKEKLDVEVVSFSVDPSVDTPDVLKGFITKFTNDERNWHLLTGYSQQEIESFAREEFQTLIQKPKSSNQVIHSTSFYLIDQNGKSVKHYGFQKTHYDEIINDVKKLYE
ncbi:SCO family protein [Bacillus sp. 1P10SD]|uniref:SCO family protein n=1 Tax=Bacillus sp. 1P10SD TaxID=3132265 RepID=UPI0039A61962